LPFFYFWRVAVLVAVAPKYILRMKEKPGPAITGALRKQNILRGPAAIGTASNAALHWAFSAHPTVPPPSVTIEDAAGFASQAAPTVLPRLRREAEDSGQFLYSTPRDF
jgi:hypothetical protein